jgi:hypothetical protein
MISREERDAARQQWVKEMGLMLRHNCKCQHNFIDRIMVYEWPKGDGRKYDRDLIILVYEDGSWTSALDDGTINVVQSKEALQRMALAAEQKGE